jgi:hypothetical protein
VKRIYEVTYRDTSGDQHSFKLAAENFSAASKRARGAAIKHAKACTSWGRKVQRIKSIVDEGLIR